MGIQMRIAPAFSSETDCVTFEAAEAALAEVRLVARYEETAEHAAALLAIVHEVASVSSADRRKPGPTTDDDRETFSARQARFVTAARRELKAGDRLAAPGIRRPSHD